jgi:hypothetical protein
VIGELYGCDPASLRDLEGIVETVRSARATTQQLFSAERLRAVLQGAENPYPTIRAWSLR